MKNGFHLNRVFVCIVLVPVMLNFLCGCREQKEYVYDNKNTAECFLKKSVYSDNKLVLYFNELKYKDFEIKECIDSDFVDLGRDYDISFSGNKVIIQGDNAENISGITFDFGHMKYRFRYLDSNQYAFLEDVFAYDEGWETEGDERAYYTEEEMSAINSEREEKRKQEEEEERVTEEIYNTFEGVYICPNDESLYIKIDLDERGNRIIEINVPIYEYDETMRIDYAFYIEAGEFYTNPCILFEEIGGFDKRQFYICYSEDNKVLYFEGGESFIKQ